MTTERENHATRHTLLTYVQRAQFGCLSTKNLPSSRTSFRLLSSTYRQSQLRELADSLGRILGKPSEGARRLDCSEISSGERVVYSEDETNPEDLLCEPSSTPVGDSIEMSNNGGPLGEEVNAGLQLPPSASPNVLPTDQGSKLGWPRDNVRSRAHIRFPGILPAAEGQGENPGPIPDRWQRYSRVAAPHKCAAGGPT